MNMHQHQFSDSNTSNINNIGSISEGIDQVKKIKLTQNFKNYISKNYVFGNLVPKTYIDSSGKLLYIFTNFYTKKIEKAFKIKNSKQGIEAVNVNDIETVSTFQIMSINQNLGTDNTNNRIENYLNPQNARKNILNIPKFESLLKILDQINFDAKNLNIEEKKSNRIKNPSFTGSYIYTNTKGIEYLIQAKKGEIIQVQAKDGSIVSPQQKGAILRAVNSSRYNRFSGITEYNNPETREKFAKETFTPKLNLDRVITRSKEQISSIQNGYGLTLYSEKTNNITNNITHKVNDTLDTEVKQPDLIKLSSEIELHSQFIMNYQSNSIPTDIQIKAALKLLKIFNRNETIPQDKLSSNHSIIQLISSIGKKLLLSGFTPESDQAIFTILEKLSAIFHGCLLRNSSPLYEKEKINEFEFGSNLDIGDEIMNTEIPADQAVESALHGHRNNEQAKQYRADSQYY